MNGQLSNTQRRLPARNASRLGKAGRFLFIAMVWLFPVLAAPAVADDATDGPIDFPIGDYGSLVLFPPGHVYDAYIADPVRPGFSMIRMGVLDSDISDAGKSRYNFILGGQHGILKFRSEAFPGMAVQMDIYGAFMGQFDMDNSTDNIGWDGLYGIKFSWTDGDGLALKLAMQHDSSHLGDEYEERTGRRRIGYTRQEVVFGVSCRLLKYVRLYAETGYGYDLRNPDLQKPWRVKGGMEFEEPGRFFNGRLGYYTAVDLSFTEELDWDADIALQAGVVIPVTWSFSTIRIGPMYRNGRSVIGEFFRQKEEWWGLGLWIDI